MTYIWSFDPGVETAIVRGYFDATTTYEPSVIYQFTGGVQGLEGWLDRYENDVKVDVLRGGVVVSEKFIPRPIENGSHTLESTLPLVQEGLLIGRGVMPAYPKGNWQPAAAQYLSGGDSIEERKKLHQDLMKRAGLWLTGTDVGRPDANDANSATGHLLHFLTRTLRHGPTIELIYGGNNG